MSPRMTETFSILLYSRILVYLETDILVSKVEITECLHSSKCTGLLLTGHD